MQRLKNLHLLLVEDDVQIRQSFVKTLSHFFDTIHEASNGIEALELFHQHRIDFVLTDFAMPQMSAPQFIKTLRQYNPTLPIAIISNYDDKETILECIPLHLIGYIFKPLTYTKLKTFLEETLLPTLEATKRHFTFTHDTYMEGTKLCVRKVVHTLTLYEMRLIEMLALHWGDVVPFVALESYVYGDESLNKSGLKNLVYRIKKKYDFPYIQNIKELGYTLEVPQ